MNAPHQNQQVATCRPAPTSPAAAAAQRRGQVAVEVYDTRRARLRLLIDERAGGSQRAFAKELGYTRSNIFNFLSPIYNHGRSIGERAARKLEHKAGLAYGWLDQELPAGRAPTPRSVADIDVDQLPPVPAGIVYAITTYGDQRADDDPASAVTLGKIIADIRAIIIVEQPA